ncbi:PepSY-associated TM helix domain-containing protein [Myxococcus sp. CA040A]|uniref:PepSY-associated TM helix domain-containing protein n=1 Tax=Myxococcus sp. CA040A TaxID=2741738 RepID=UPI00157B5A65|nr:PepSY-associated TM helix domain-containing protein [Myxococcus sp. CA040A]NTX02407.1 PepSY domain-containing protein [Myxococcus sp. CA040A]
MALPLRKPLFWIHLVVGVVVGIVVAIMSVTGVAIAFESQVLEWAEAEARAVPAPEAEVRRLPIEALVAKVREAKPEAQVSGVTVYPSATAAAQVALGRAGVVFVNPYTGEVREGGAKGWRDFFHVMEDWHRWLATGGDNRAIGKAITGASNAGFLFLALSGLYLWWPRKWTLKTVRPVLWFKRGLKGKPRDFNWHNVIGLWSMPVLVVLTASGMVISYKWASDFVYSVTGNAAPATQGPPGSAGVKVTPPESGGPRKELGALLATVQEQVPAWSSITYRLPSPPRGAGGQDKPSAPPGQAPSAPPQAGQGEPGARAEAPVVAGERRAESPVTNSERRTETPAGEGAPRAESRGGAPVGEGERRVEAPAAEGERRAESRGGAPVGEGERRVEAPAAEGERRAESRGGAPVAEGERRVEAPAAEGERRAESRGGAPVAEGERRAEGKSRGESRGPKGDSDGKVDAVTFNVKEQDGWPLFASTQFSVDPFSGVIAKREGFADFNSGRKLRTWLRFLHTGEALGWVGQLIAAMASLGGVFLVWTGFALSWRRFFPKRNPRTSTPVPASSEPTPVSSPETPA